MSKQKRYFLEGNTIIDSPDGKGGWITYTKQTDGSVFCASSDPDRPFWENPVIGKEAEDLWKDLVDRAINSKNMFYYEGPY